MPTRNGDNVPHLKLIPPFCKVTNMNSDEYTLNYQEADRIQFILWCVTHGTMEDIKRETAHYDLEALWSKFLMARNIDRSV